MFLPGTFDDIGLCDWVYILRFLLLVALLLGLGGKGFEFKIMPYSSGTCTLLLMFYLADLASLRLATICRVTLLIYFISRSSDM